MKKVLESSQASSVARIEANTIPQAGRVRDQNSMSGQWNISLLLLFKRSKLFKEFSKV